MEQGEYIALWVENIALALFTTARPAIDSRRTASPPGQQESTNIPRQAVRNYAPVDNDQIAKDTNKP